LAHGRVGRLQRAAAENARLHEQQQRVERDGAGMRKELQSLQALHQRTSHALERCEAEAEVGARTHSYKGHGYACVRAPSGAQTIRAEPMK
jgi:hypothetical protein